MNLFEILEGLKNDPTLAIHLYKKLHESHFLALVRKTNSQDANTFEFLTYPSTDNVIELPIFTEQKFVLNSLVSDQNQIVSLEGKIIWPRLYEILNTVNCQVALNPGHSHGIRLTNQMILGMISKYNPEALK